MNSTVIPGADRIVRKPEGGLLGRRLGMVTNDIARLADGLTRSRAALIEAGYELVRLFGPEHGLGASAEDGAAVGDATDSLTGLPAVSLYGANLRPPLATLEDLDAVVFDIPDVGSRYYTFIWTLSHVLEACAEARRPLWVLDRPNPLGGEMDWAEGPVLDESRFSTFVGRWSMPARYSLTVGELARLWKAKRGIDVELHVVECEGWKRSMLWPATGLPFVPTSPAMHDFETALLYAGTCLLEGTNVSEGRGTPTPFKWMGAPWLDGQGLARRFNALGLAGLEAEAQAATPDVRKYSGQHCEGIRLHVTDAQRARPLAAGLWLVWMMAAAHRDKFTWHPYPTAANQGGGGHFDRLVGIDQVRTTIDAKEPDAQTIARWTDVGDWGREVEGSLGYGE